jgi:hypothetical protein
MRIPSVAIALLVIIHNAAEAINLRGKLLQVISWSCRPPTVVLAAIRQLHQLRHPARYLPRLHEVLGYQAGLDGHVLVYEGHVHRRLGFKRVQAQRLVGSSAFMPRRVPDQV